MHSLLSPPFKTTLSPPMNGNVCLLKVTAVLERSLGDVSELFAVVLVVVSSV